MSQDEIAVMDGGKCIMQLRGVRPFFSDKFDITKHGRYKELSDYDQKNTFDIEDYVKHLQHMKVTLNTEVDDAFDCGEVSGQEEDSPSTTEQQLLDIMSKSAELKTEYGTVNQPQDFRTKRPEAMKRSFECIWERTKIKAPGTANRQTECTGCPQGSSQRIALSLSYHKAGHFTRKTLSETRQNYF